MISTQWLVHTKSRLPKPEGSAATVSLTTSPTAAETRVNLENPKRKRGQAAVTNAMWSLRG